MTATRTTSDPAGGTSPPDRRSRWLLMRALDFAPLIVLVCLLGVFAVIDPRIVGPGNLYDVLGQATPIALLALGAFVVLLSGGIDLSAGFGVGLAAVVMASRHVADAGLVEMLAWGLLVGVGLGLVNGLLVGAARFPPFVATLSTMIMVQGLILFVATGGVLLVNEPLLAAVGRGTAGPLPMPVVATAAVAVLFAAVMRGTRFGMRTYGLGSNAEATGLSGVPLVRQTIMVYATGGLMTALTAILLVGRVSIVAPNTGGISLLLDAIAAAVIGGTSIYGGKGTVGGVVTGALIIALLTNALRVFGVDASSIDLFKGLVIIIALVADAGMRRAHVRLEPGNQTA